MGADYQMRRDISALVELKFLQVDWALTSHPDISRLPITEK